MKPENVLTGTVVGRFLFGLGDGPDVDNEPDFVAARGRVTFIPGESTHPDPSAFPVPVTMLLDPVVGVFDSEGYLCTPNAEGTAGTRGVKLVANNNPALLVQDWTWNVTYKFESSTGVTHTIKPHGLNVDANEETDLVTAIKLPTSPGIPLEQVEAAVFRAEAEARAARETVDEIAALAAATIDKTLVEATVVGDDLVLTRENGVEVIAGNVRGEPGPAGPNTVPTDEAVAGNLETDGTATRAAVLTVVDSREVGNAQLADQAVTGEKIAPDTVGLDRLTQGMRDQFGQYEQDIEDRPTVAVASSIANSSADLARSSTAVVTTGTYAGASYKMIRVIGAAGKPGLIGKRFGNDFTTPPHGEGFSPTQESLASVFKRTGADIIANAGGWVVAPESPRNGFMDGCQILDGVLYRDFNDPGYYRGRHAIGVHWDGSLHLYSADDGDTGASMVAAGVRNSFSFGPPLVKGGVAQTADAVTISGRQLMAVTAGGDLLLVTVQGTTGLSGLTYQQCGTLLASLGASFAVPMDGGGSAQTLVRGRWTSPSSDSAGPRSTVDFLTIHAKIVGDVSTPPYPLEPKNGFTAHAQTPRVQLVDGALFFTGALVNETATAPTVAATLPWWARPEAYQRFPATTGAIQQYYDVATTGDLSLYSSAATGASPRYLSAIRYPAKPI